MSVAAEQAEHLVEGAVGFGEANAALMSSAVAGRLDHLGTRNAQSAKGR
ncbi:hypothetical protein AB0B92_34335 [Streptomyces hygroscopicus]|nr:hypothetical protein [Streptomyces sp. RKCA744]MCO8308959.1 hypothetical protein [Streptomyces sp. RKCA744]